MSRSDRQEIAGLTAVSTGHGSSRPNSKKRPRDDERVGGGRNPNPFSSLSRNNLHEPKRVTNTQTSSVTHSGNISNHSLGFSRKKAHTSPLANRTFPEQSTSSSRHSSGILNGSGSFTPDDHESTFHSELLSFANGFTNQTRPSPPLTDLDRIILGQRECERDVLPMADFWNSAPPPDSPPAKTTLPQPSLAQQPRSSSSDPIDLLANSGIPNIESTDPIVVDDDDDEIPIRQPRSRTPNRQTQFKPGYVKEKVREANSHSAPKPVSSQPTIVPYLASSSSKPPLSANVPTALPKSASSSKGQPIPVGISRKADSNGNHSSIIRNMKAKPTKPQSGLKLASVGLSKDVSTSKAKESSQKQQPNPPAIPSADAQMKVQEWYCANRRHGAGENVRQKYMLCFTKNHIVLRHRQALGDQLMLLKWDLVGFEVAEASEGDDKQEFIPALVITVTEKFASSPGWQRFSGQDTYPRVVVLFDTSDEAVTNDWSLLVSHLETMMPKSVVRIDSMKKLIKLRMEANLPAQQTARSTSSIPTRAERSEDLEVVPAEVPPTMHGPSTRTRTKAGITRPKDEAPKTPPRPPLKDPDEIMLVYPRNGPGAVNINRAELARLEDGEFLNDTLIELGLKLWINGLRAKDRALADEIHVFNSFFFKKLDGGRSKPCDYSSVKKWTAKIDLFKKKFVVVPINEHLHWYLAIICFPENVLQAPPPQPPIQPTRKTRSSNAGATQADGSRVPSEGALPNAEKGSIADGEAGSPLQQGSTEVDNDLAYRSQNSMVIDVEMLEEAAATPDVPVDPEAGKSRSLSTPPILDMTKYEIEDEIGGNSSAQKCWIVIFDSLRGKHGRTIRILREYLQAEAQERHGKIVDTKSAESSGGFIVDKHLPVPEQPNWCDCGVYVLHYVEAFTANPLSILTFPVSKRKLSPDGIMRYNELWRTEEVKKKRENFRSTVNDLSTEWREFRLISTKQPPDAHYASLLPNAGGELSVMEISPPGPTGVSKEFENNPPTSPTKSPPRTGILPMLLIDEQPPLLPGLTSSLHSDQDQDEKEVEAEVFNPDDGTKTSDSSNSSNKRTRRGLKGGIRHNTRRHSLETPSSPEL